MSTVEGASGPYKGPLNRLNRAPWCSEKSFKGKLDSLSCCLHLTCPVALTQSLLSLPYRFSILPSSLLLLLASSLPPPPHYPGFPRELRRMSLRSNHLQTLQWLQAETKLQAMTNKSPDLP